jgi:hypothetical protein
MIARNCVQWVKKGSKPTQDLCTRNPGMLDQRDPQPVAHSSKCRCLRGTCRTWQRLNIAVRHTHEMIMRILRKDIRASVTLAINLRHVRRGNFAILQARPVYLSEPRVRKDVARAVLQISISTRRVAFHELHD